MDVGYRIEVAGSLEEVEKLRPLWEGMQCHPETEIDFYVNTLSSRSSVLRPHVAVLYKENKPIAIMVGRLEQVSVVLKIGYFILRKIPVKSLTVPYCGFLGLLTDSESQQFVAHVHCLLKRGDADVAHFYYLRLDSVVLLSIRRTTRVIFRDIVTSSRDHWTMHLSQNKEDFWKDIRLKHRKLITHTKRWQKALNEDFGAKVAFREYHEPSDVQQLCLDAEEITQKTYQRGLGVGFQDNFENRQRLEFEGRHRSLRGYVLRVGGKPVSFWIGSVCRDTFFVTFLSYDPSFSKYSPGTLVFMHMIESLCDEGIRHVDFGFGTSFYKERFGDTHWRETSIYLFAPLCCPQHSANSDTLN
jgi:hypothetical protein